MKGTFPINKFRELRTPFYYYDTKVLRDTLSHIRTEVAKYGNYSVHYAVKANANPKVLAIIRENCLGADCVSGGEIRAAIKAGFPTDKIVFAGVGKADWEINLGLDYDIFCFNVESVPELEIINELAAAKGKIANVAFRINPNVGAHTHANITTGLAENKFGISMQDMNHVIDMAHDMKNLRFIGLHFHIGSQILDMGDFVALCNRINELQDKLEARHIRIEHVNVGGGLGIDYGHPNRQSIPDFKSYFETYNSHLKLRPHQTLHFELGRAVVGQCGSLISQVLYVKQGTNKQFAILDAGMTDLIRPALYQAFHKIENITSDAPVQTYDVVGPICESSDVFGKAIDLNGVKRGDFIA
ncbi:diaminopimelate decarboxylase, partial [uncultured Bacteroides sp.]